MGKIKALEPEVIHKIAAGEIIVSPANALKELLENSLDAGATSIEVVVKNGGHKLLQVTDNGNGIDDDDFEILCQRFTTSKISNFRDLESVKTLGFRGEALASISHISHLTVRTKTQTARTASLITYKDGKLVTKKLAAGTQGTQITVEDLFYNSPLRSLALQNEASGSGEYQKILDIVSKYSIQYPGTFSCKRHQDSQPVVISGSTKLDKLRKVYGNTTSQSLHAITVDAIKSIGLTSVSGYVSGLNYQSKRSVPFIFFINKRLVSCDSLSRSIRKVYQDFMPKGNSGSFVYLSIEVYHQNIDINVHPTKREVFFLHETEIIESICDKIKQLLENTENERDYRIQSYIATSVPDVSASLRSDRDNQNLIIPQSASQKRGTSLESTFATGSKPRYEYNLVRTDPHQRKITSFIRSNTSPVKVRSEVRSSPSKMDNEQMSDSDDYQDSDLDAMGDDSTDKEKTYDNQQQLSTDLKASASMGHNKSYSSTKRPESPVKKLAEQNPKKEFKQLDLVSINELLLDVKNRSHMNLLYLFSEHTFVGVVDRKRNLGAVQVGIRLYLIEYLNVFSELFYQIALLQLGNFGSVHFGDGLSITQLLALAPEAEGGISVNFQELIDMRQMLEEYFQICLREKAAQGWCLVQLPVLVPGYRFPISRIPQFVADLVNHVNWKDEGSCFRDVATALSTLHLPVLQSKSEDIRLLFETVKTSLVPSRELLPCVIEIANLPGLYKVFERC